jgi:hypothetical protein
VAEDYNISSRIQQAGMLCHYNPSPFTISHQVDNIYEIARKHVQRLVGNKWNNLSFIQYLRLSTRDFLQRFARNILKLRWNFLFFDFLVFVLGFHYFNQIKNGKSNLI